MRDTKKRRAGARPVIRRQGRAPRGRCVDQNQGAGKRFRPGTESRCGWKPGGLCALFRAFRQVPMTTSLQRSVPTVLAALAGFAIAAGAVRLERAFRAEKEAAQLPRATVRASDEPHLLQQQRALETGRGRRAETPARIPWPGWKDIVW